MDQRTALGNGTACRGGASKRPAFAVHRSNIREWYRPQARIAGHLTLYPLVGSSRTAVFCWSNPYCPGEWHACYIPPGKLPVRFDDFQMHNGV
jgi:hypothetical protein